MTIDHGRAVRDPRYLSRRRSKIQAGATRPGLRDLEVIHDHNGACCRREPWPATLAKLVGPLVADVTQREPADVQALLREHEPLVILAGRESEVSERSQRRPGTFVANAEQIKPQPPDLTRKDDHK